MQIGVFMLKIEFNNNVYEYDPTSGQTILEFLKEQKENVRFQCQDGYCGVCRCKMKKGKVKEIQESIGFKNNDEILPCISIPDTDITIINTVNKI